MSLDPVRITVDNVAMKAALAEERQETLAQCAPVQAEDSPQRLVAAHAAPGPQPVAVILPPAIRQAIVAGVPVAALTTASLGPATSLIFLALMQLKGRRLA